MPPRLLVILALLLAGTVLPGQTRKLLGIEVEEEGFYYLPFSRLSSLIDIRHLDTRRLALYLQGRQIPIEVRGTGDGRIDPIDGIAFYAPPSASHHTHRIPLVLALTDHPRRIRRDTRLSTGEASDFGRVEVKLEEDRIFVPSATVRRDVIRGDRRPPHWLWKRLPAPLSEAGGDGSESSAATFVLPKDPEPRPGSGALLILDVLGPPADGVRQKLVISVNGQRISTLEWDDALDRSLEVKVPSGVLRRHNDVQIRNVSPQAFYAEPGNEVGQRRRNVIFVDRLTLRFQALLAGPSLRDEQVIYRLAPTGEKTPRLLHFTSMLRRGYALYDVHSGTIIASRTVMPSRTETRTVVCGTGESLKEVDRVRPLRITHAHERGPGADYLVVTTTRLRPLIERLVLHRRSQGLRTVVVEAAELYDTFTHGAFSPQAIRSFVSSAWKDWERKPRYLLLVGDADRDVDWISTKETLPAALVMTDYNALTASDAVYGDPDGDGMPDIAVGRLPVRNRAELVSIIERIIALETHPEPGPWRRALAFVAGPARFNPTVDKLLETAMRNVLTRTIPQRFRITLTYANPSSPYFWPAPFFKDEVIRLFNTGALAFTYVGHGSPFAFDRIRVGDSFRTIMDSRDVSRINAGSRNPLVTIIACWTGDFDRPVRDSIGELLLRREGGACAVIASSRISHPFPDALLGKALAEGLTEEGRSVGELLLEAKRRMVAGADKGALALMARPFISKAVDQAALVRDHVHLYNLLGDPALRLPLPPRKIELEVSGELLPGSTLRVKGRVPGGVRGTLLISLDRPPGRLPWSRVPRIDPDLPDANRRIMQRNRAANESTLSSTSLGLEGEAFEAALQVPLGTPAGTYVLRAYVTSKAAGDGAAALPLRIAPKRKKRGSGDGNGRR